MVKECLDFWRAAPCVSKSLIAITLIFSSWAIPQKNTNDPLSMAAQYYFKRHDFSQSLQLWEEALKKDPRNLETIIKISDLKLMVEGRAASRQILEKFLEDYRQKLTPDQKKLLKEQWQKTQNTFLTDSGQSYYLQALSFIQNKEFQRALTLLTQSDSMEHGNSLVLYQKAECEKSTGAFSAFLNTLKEAWTSNPFDLRVRSDLTMAYVYFQQFDKVIELVGKDIVSQLGPPERLAYGYALLQSNSFKEAKPILQDLLLRASSGTAHPMVYFALGKALMMDPTKQQDGILYLQKFVALSPKLCADGNWDPYACVDRQNEAKKLIESTPARS